MTLSRPYEEYHTTGHWNWLFTCDPEGDVLSVFVDKGDGSKEIYGLGFPSVSAAKRWADQDYENETGEKL